MSNDQSKLWDNILMGFTGLLSLWSIVGLCFVLIQSPVPQKITALFGTGAFVYFFIYYFKGSRKADAGHFKNFVYCFALYQFINLVMWSIVGFMEPAVGYIAAVIAFLLICCLAFGRDLGKNKSMTGSWIVCALCVIALVVQKASAGGASGTFSSINANNMLDFSRAVMSINLVIAMKHKYDDKKTRNTI